MCIRDRCHLRHKPRCCTHVLVILSGYHTWESCMLCSSLSLNEQSETSHCQTTVGIIGLASGWGKDAYCHDVDVEGLHCLCCGSPHTHWCGYSYHILRNKQSDHSVRQSTYFTFSHYLIIHGKTLALVLSFVWGVCSSVFGVILWWIMLYLVTYSIGCFTVL